MVRIARKPKSVVITYVCCGCKEDGVSRIEGELPHCWIDVSFVQNLQEMDRSVFCSARCAAETIDNFLVGLDERDVSRRSVSIGR